MLRTVFNLFRTKNEWEILNEIKKTEIKKRQNELIKERRRITRLLSKLQNKTCMDDLEIEDEDDEDDEEEI